MDSWNEFNFWVWGDWDVSAKSNVKQHNTLNFLFFPLSMLVYVQKQGLKSKKKNSNLDIWQI